MKSDLVFTSSKLYLNIRFMMPRLNVMLSAKGVETLAHSEDRRRVVKLDQNSLYLRLTSFFTGYHPIAILERVAALAEETETLTYGLHRRSIRINLAHVSSERPGSVRTPRVGERVPETQCTSPHDLRWLLFQTQEHRGGQKNVDGQHLGYFTRFLPTRKRSSRRDLTSEQTFERCISCL